MNWTMGCYIDELDAEGRDRLIAAPEFSDGEWWRNGCGCLVGTAEDMGRFFDPTTNCLMGECEEAFDDIARPHDERPVPWIKSAPAHRYPAAVTRFGKARVVRAIKLRAARENGCSPEQIQAMLRETVSA